MRGNKPENKQYDPQTYKRLELVRKQFRNDAAEQRKLQSAESKQKFLISLAQNKAKIVRIAVYVILGIVVLTVIGVVIAGAVGK